MGNQYLFAALGVIVLAAGIGLRDKTFDDQRRFWGIEILSFFGIIFLALFLMIILPAFAHTEEQVKCAERLGEGGLFLLYAGYPIYLITRLIVWAIKAVANKD